MIKFACLCLFYLEAFVLLFFQMTLTYSTNKARVMPGVTKGLQKLVSSLDRELTAMAASPKQAVEVF